MNEIIIAPFSNSVIRDWPREYYTALVGIILHDLGFSGYIRIIGTVNQRLGACEIVRPYPADRVINECGRIPWSGVLKTLSTAACVIGNNSGIAHLSGSYGTPTVCVFGGSHQRLEWRPRGKNVVVLSRAIGCSPCQLDHGSISPFGKACLREITPGVVSEAVLAIMAQRG